MNFLYLLIVCMATAVNCCVQASEQDESIDPQLFGDRYDEEGYKTTRVLHRRKHYYTERALTGETKEEAQERHARPVRRYEEEEPARRGTKRAAAEQQGPRKGRYYEEERPAETKREAPRRRWFHRQESEE